MCIAKEKKLLMTEGERTGEINVYNGRGKKKEKEKRKSVVGMLEELRELSLCTVRGKFSLVSNKG